MIKDTYGRALRSLRISVTDRCNLRCQYCMPEDSYVWLSRESILSFEEIERLAEIFAKLGATKIRFTGGEPLLRRDFPDCVSRVASVPGLDDLALTTNGLLLASLAGSLKDAGLDRITVSLDTLREDRFRFFARSGRHADVLAGIDAAQAAGFGPIKINTVVMRDYNEDEIEGLVAFARERDAEVRFIEYMDVGGATDWSMDRVVPKRAILDRLEKAFGRLEPVLGRGSAPAERFRLEDGTTVGVIASTTEPFCSDCDRARITADGVLYQCLYAKNGLDVKGLLRSGAPDDAIADQLCEHWQQRDDRGAEVRVTLRGRRPLYEAESLRANPHLEMHTRGG